MKTIKQNIELNDTTWNDDVTIPLEHQKIVLNRMAKAKSNPKRLLDWNKVSKTL